MHASGKPSQAILVRTLPLAFLPAILARWFGGVAHAAALFVSAASSLRISPTRQRVCCGLTLMAKRPKRRQTVLVEQLKTPATTLTSISPESGLSSKVASAVGMVRVAMLFPFSESSAPGWRGAWRIEPVEMSWKNGLKC